MPADICGVRFDSICRKTIFAIKFICKSQCIIFIFIIIYIYLGYWMGWNISSYFPCKILCHQYARIKKTHKQSNSRTGRIDGHVIYYVFMLCISIIITCDYDICYKTVFPNILIFRCISPCRCRTYHMAMCIIIILIVFPEPGKKLNRLISFITFPFVYRKVVCQDCLILVVYIYRQCVIPPYFFILIGYIGSVALNCQISFQRLPLIHFSIRVFLTT